MFVGPVSVARAEVLLVPYPLRRTFAAAHQDVGDRAVIVVRIDTDAGVGWAECPTLPGAGYGPTGTAEEFAALVRIVLPSLVARASVSAEQWSRDSGIDGHRAAVGAVEAALLDVEGRASGESLAVRLGARRSSVPAGAAVGLGDSAEAAAEAARLVAEGYGRIKAKIGPGSDSAVLAAIRETCGSELDLQADANGVYGADAIPALALLEAFALSSLEQPFAAEDLESHARLSAATSTPVCLDEAVTGLDAVEAAARARACSLISVKWSRLGGPLAAARMVTRSRSLGLGVTIGGMLSSGLGRAVDVALAALDGVDVVGDQSGSARYADFDLTEPLEVVRGVIAVPAAPGLGLEVDVDRIERTATERVSVTASD